MTKNEKLWKERLPTILVIWIKIEKKCNISIYSNLLKSFCCIFYPPNMFIKTLLPIYSWPKSTACIYIFQGNKYGDKNKEKYISAIFNYLRCLF